MTDTLYYSEVPSPVGRLTLVSNGRALTAVHMDDEDAAPSPPAGSVRSDERLAEARAQLEAYFAGGLRRFSLPLEPDGTPFQRAVWAALVEIPFGRTASYADVARRIGRPGAARAVGAANGRNPLAIVVPCHRVVAADGSLGGYAGGLERKRRLLAHEARVAGALV